MKNIHQRLFSTPISLSISALALSLSSLMASAGNSLNVIENCTDLQNINTDLAGNYEILADLSSIDCSGVEFLPIGNGATEFTGSFNGNGVPIENLWINSPLNDYVGLFGAIGGQARIENVTINNANVTGKNNVGLLIGARTQTIAYPYQATVIANNHVSGRLYEATKVGGLIGYIDYVYYQGSDSTFLENNQVSGLELRTQANVEAKAIGGLVGEGYRTRIENSHAEGSISTENKGYEIGGLVGLYHIENVGINNSSAQVEILNPNAGQVGGLVGSAIVHVQNNNSNAGISNSYALGNVSGNAYIGGLIGMTTNYGYSPFPISNSFAKGDVSATERHTGGLIGYADGVAIKSAFATGNVVSSSSYVGGLIGYAGQRVTINNAYAQGGVIGTNDIGGLIGSAYIANVSNAYAVGHVSPRENSALAGGLIGDIEIIDESTVQASFWDVDTSGQTSSAAGIGARTADLQNQQVYEQYGWDFTNIWQPITVAQYPQLQYE